MTRKEKDRDDDIFSDKLIKINNPHYRSIFEELEKDKERERERDREIASDEDWKRKVGKTASSLSDYIRKGKKDCEENETLDYDKIINYKIGYDKIINYNLEKKNENNINKKYKLNEGYSINENLFNEFKTNYNFSNYYSKSLIGGIGLSPQGINLKVRDKTDINADNLGEFALPIVEYIAQTKPDYIVASDRGARLLGLAVFKLFKRLHGRLPTTDGTIRFRRFSKSNSQEQTDKHLEPLVDEMVAHRDRPKVLVLDDWVCSGGTKRIAEETFDRLSKGKVRMSFGVLVGNGGDVSGSGHKTSGFAGVTDWRDDSDIIGVKYGSNDYGGEGIRAKPVITEQSISYRKRMTEGIEKLIAVKFEEFFKKLKKTVTAEREDRVEEVAA